MGSFTPNLGLSQPTPGDPAVANLWGGILNTNAGLIDSSISGLLSKSVAGSSNVVLTVSNGATDEARYAMFNFTGILTGNINVLWPGGITGKFIVKNSTTGAFTLSLGVNNGSGSPVGSTVVVPSGATGSYYSDGVNVNGVVSFANQIFSNPTFTGTVTGPDSGTWTSGGLNSITKLGIGMVPVNILDITKNQNGFSREVLLNNSGGASAIAGYSLTTGSTIGDLRLYGPGFSSSGLAIADSLLLYGTGAGGLSLATGQAQPIRFGINTVEACRVGSDGSFLVGTTTNAGAGCIAATGNVTASASDDRLKTRKWPIADALHRLKTLDAFVYKFNARALALGLPEGEEVGLSAQQVQKVLPQVVCPSPADPTFLTIRYERVVPLLVAAIKELELQVADLRGARG